MHKIIMPIACIITAALIIAIAVTQVMEVNVDMAYGRMIAEAEDILMRAASCNKRNEFQSALDICNELLNDSRFNEYPERDKFKDLIKMVEERIARETEARMKADELINKVRNADKTQYEGLEKELIRFIREYGEMTSAEDIYQQLVNIRNLRKEEMKQLAVELFKTARDEADKFVEEGQFEKALEIWRQLARDNPEASAILQKKINSEISRLKKLIENDSR